uniref:ATP synthase subunit a n=1 Tax=Rhipiphorothrips cruentatus TaxID=764491 RepID=A0A8A5L8Q7_9NEOP|nr:ATP synthase F0 subunit 6 [Rhipiphorothrips cruentatus]
MLMNLFSSFDPITSFFGLMPLNWISALLHLLLIPSLFWVKKNRMTYILFKILNFLFKEISIVMTGKKTGAQMIFISLLLFIMFNNFMGLFPYIFTASSHLTFSLLFALSLWISFMMFGWINLTNSMFSHLLPMGTPMILMPFLVCIETISNIIRPGTLSIRLTANMISGHLLMTLLGNQGSSISLILMIFFILIQSMLLILEVSVSIIQAYVFSILSSLYSGELNSH